MVNEKAGGPAPVLVVIPVAGRPGLVIQALESVKKQTLPPARVCTVIDSRGPVAREDRMAVESSYQSPGWDPGTGLEIRSGPGTGPSGARNAGALGCEEKWIAFLDSDDLWAPEKLETQLEYLKARPFLQACHTAETWIKNGSPLQIPLKLKSGPGAILPSSLERCMVSPSSILLSSGEFHRLGGFDESFLTCEDYELWIRFFLENPMGYLDRPLTIKRSGDWDQLSQTHSMDAARIQAILKNYKILKENQGSRVDQVLEEKLRILEAGSNRHGSRDTLETIRRSIQKAQENGEPDGSPEP